MNKFLSVIALGAVLSFNAMAQPAAGTAAADKPLSSQQSKMGSCNTDAKTKALTGDNRKTFMKSCLSAGSTPAVAAPSAKTTQQEKMKTCNADAKTKALAGDARKTFMKTCLSNAPAA